MRTSREEPAMESVERTMIHLNENLIRLADVPSVLPRSRRGRKVGVSTVYRWTARGVRGVVLETIRIGGSRYTSMEALERFSSRLSAAKQDLGDTRTRETPAARRRAQQAASKHLDDLGI